MSQLRRKERWCFISTSAGKDTPTRFFTCLLEPAALNSDELKPESCVNIAAIVNTLPVAVLRHRRQAEIFALLYPGPSVGLAISGSTVWEWKTSWFQTKTSDV